MAMKQLTNILTKKPFGKAMPTRVTGIAMSDNLNIANYPDNDRVVYKIVSQADFIRELDPNGHIINDEHYYPNRIKRIPKKDFNGVEVKDSNGNTVYQTCIQYVLRATFPFQEIIKTQQLIHLCGNDLHHELNTKTEDESTQKLFEDFKKGWCSKQMDSSFFKWCDGIKGTGDSAIVYYYNNGKMGTRVLSYLDGDTLYPHYDSISGELNCFARKYSAYNEDGDAVVNYVEVWDEKYLYRYSQSLTGFQGAVNKVAAFFKLDGYSLLSVEEHKCNQVPIVYYRDPSGACWSKVQDNIDMYELGFSHLCQNNMAYAFPILVLKGDNVDIEGDLSDGAVKGITGDKDMEADYLKAPESPESFKLQLEVMLKNIFLGSFTVQPPEIKSGDTPGVAVKLIYSPSIEKAMMDIANLSTSIQKMTELFKYFYGLETASLVRMMDLDILTWAIPYVHQNTSELINNLVQQVGGGILSKQTASETTGFGKNNEWQRIIDEQKEAQQSDALSMLVNKQKAAVEKANQTVSTAQKQQQSNTEIIQ